MSEALPLAVLALTVVLLAAMPWHRPHPNHQFILDLLRFHLLEGERTTSHPPAVVIRGLHESGEGPIRRPSDS